MRMVVVSVSLGVIVMCRSGRCHFEILPCSPFSDLFQVPSPLSLAWPLAAPYCAAWPPAEANVFAGLVAYFFFAASTQEANSWSVTTLTAIGMKA